MNPGFHMHGFSSACDPASALASPLTLSCHQDCNFALLLGVLACQSEAPPVPWPAKLAITSLAGMLACQFKCKCELLRRQRCSFVCRLSISDAVVVAWCSPRWTSGTVHHKLAREHGAAAAGLLQAGLRHHRGQHQRRRRSAWHRLLAVELHQHGGGTDRPSGAGQRQCVPALLACTSHPVHHLMSRRLELAAVLEELPCLPAKLVGRKLCFGAFEPSAVAPNLNPGTPAGFLPEHYGQQASGAHARCVLICPVASTHSITRQLCCAELHVCAATRGPVFTQTIGPFSQRVSGRCPTNSGAGGTTATSTAGRRLLQVCAEFVNVICYGPALSWVYRMLRGCFVITLSG